MYKLAWYVSQFNCPTAALIFRIRPSALDGVGGEYWPGTTDGSKPGVFYVNLHSPEYKCVSFTNIGRRH